MRQSLTRGFSLIELMVVMTIAAILAAIAYPSYSDSIKKGRRADAMGSLLAFSNAMERHFTENNTYLGAGVSGANTGIPAIFAGEAPLEGSVKYYDLRIQAATADSYTLRATPKNTQAGDGILEITSLGVRGWDRNGDNDTSDAGENRWEK